MNTQEITINSISSTDLNSALEAMDSSEEILALLFDLMDDYKESPSAKLMRDWFKGRITLEELITEIFTFLQPNIPIAPEVHMIDFDKVDTVDIGSRGGVKITFTDGTVEHLYPNDRLSPAYTALVNQEVKKRGLISLSTERGFSRRTYTYFFQTDTESKLTKAQTRALAMLLKVQSEYEMKLANAEEGERVWRRSNFSNDELNHKVKEVLIKRGLINTGQSRFSGDVYLSEAGLELARKIAPESTVAGIKQERKSELQKARDLARITKAMKAHYAEQIKTAVPSNVELDIQVNPYMDNGVDGKAFSLIHKYQIEKYGSMKTVEIKAVVRKGRELDIVAGKGYGAGVGKYSDHSAIEIPSNKMAVFIDILQTAQSLLTELNVSPIKPYTGELYTSED